MKKFAKRLSAAVPLEIVSVVIMLPVWIVTGRTEWRWLDKFIVRILDWTER